MKVSAGGTALGTADFGRAVYRLLGLPIDAADMAEALDRIRTAAAARRPCFVSTPNLNFLIACQKDAAFRESVIRSDLSLAGGMPLVRLGRLLGAVVNFVADTVSRAPSCMQRSGLE
jgi:N-acetylglucosaminyldiphosphoundecaprenol N-acetyl-beta-D-mannosaminyltransferase